MDNRVTQWLRNELSGMSNYMMERRFYAAPANVLYEGLINDRRKHDVLMEAASYLERPRMTHSETWEIPVVFPGGRTQTLPFLVRLDGDRQYLQPESNMPLRSDSAFGQAMLEATETARNCAITEALFDDFNQILPEARQIGTMLPWARDLARGCKARSTDNATRNRFFNNQALYRDVAQNSFLTALDRLMGAGASNFPSLSPRVNEACKLGSTLLAQYRMLLEAPPVETPESFIRPQPSRAWLPEWYVADMEEIKNEWRTMQAEARDARRAKERARKVI